MKKLFFFHNPKCGGTSLMEAIRLNSPTSNVSPRIENDTHDHRRLQGDYSSFKGFDIYVGHYGRDVYEQVKDGHLYFSNFRHPVGRIISLYNYFRYLDVPVDQLALPHYVAVRFAKTQSICDFVRNEAEGVQLYVGNAHFRQLTCSFYEPAVRRSLNEALAFVAGMAAVFICEHPQASTIMLQNALSIGDVPRINVKNSVEGYSEALVGPDLYRAILERNEMDLALYDYACSMLQRNT